MKSTSLLLFAFLALPAGGAYAQASSVTSQLAAASKSLASRGMTQAERDLTGTLNDDAQTDWTIYLVKGVPYSIRGFCDNDCKDLDLILYDENNNKISEDTSTDDIPIVTVTPTWTGRFMLRVIMDDCRVNPCNYGVRIFAPR
jgi:hypothetical protein